MRLTMQERKAVTKALSLRYRTARKKFKRHILDDFAAVTGYNRNYAARLLHGHGCRRRKRCSAPRRGRACFYDGGVYSPLRQLWELMDYICGKRLKPALPELINKLEEHGELYLDDSVKAKLSRISAATIDRLLKTEREKFQLKGRSGTKPGTLLKYQIPIRTFAQWDENRPGFMEIDLVGHEGGNPRGDFIQTLDMTDVHSGWTETQGVKNKAQVHVFASLKIIEKRLPFKLLGIDSDNGSEFINAQLVRYCEENKLTFTRGRTSHKNDNCYVEQKNYSVVRRAVGYARYESDYELATMNELYRHLRLYTNYFQPTMKLAEKRRDGAQVYKRYETAQTPYARLTNSGKLELWRTEKLRAEYGKLNPAQLKRDITRLQNRLLGLSARRKRSNYE